MDTELCQTGNICPLLICAGILVKITLPKPLIPPTDLLNLPDQKSYDILNLIKLMMISIYPNAI